MKTIKKLIRRYPQQAFLFVFNSGVFAWLQTTGVLIATKLGFKSLQTEALLARIPAWLRFLANDSLEKLQSFFGSGALAWLVLSMVAMLLIRFIKGMIKFVIFALIVIVGILLIWQNQAILSNLSLF